MNNARGSLIGLAVGDAMGAPTEGMTQVAIRERFGWVTDFVDEDAAGTDDTEYAVLCARGVIRFGRSLRSADVAALWLDALELQRGGFHGAGFSEMVALARLSDGIGPPASGRNNYELWSDGAAMRIAPIGLYCAGDPDAAARLAAEDASVSHSRDGVYAAQAMAAAVAVAAVDSDWEAAISAGIARLPTDSWTHRTVARALAIVDRGSEPAETQEALYREISLFHYPWADAAPEALALAFGVIAAARGSFVGAVLAGVNMGRDSDTIAAMAGAVCGALHGLSAIPEPWQERVRSVQGRCVTATAGADLIDLADAIVAARGDTP